MKNAYGAALVLVVVLLAGVGVARAADPTAEKARAHFQQGDTYFKLDKYANALQEFEQAYLAKQDPSFLYNIAQCHRLMGNRVCVRDMALSILLRSDIWDRKGPVARSYGPCCRSGRGLTLDFRGVSIMS